MGEPCAQAMSFLSKVTLVAILVVAFLWPAVMNHGPYYFYDTRTYIRSADAAVSALTHKHTDWTMPSSTVAIPGPTVNGVADAALHNIGEVHSRSLEDEKRKGVMLGRSLFWGMLLYAGSSSGFWLTIILQSMSLVLLVVLCLRSLDVLNRLALAVVCLGLCVLSNVGFFTSYLMPDLYGGFAVVCCAQLLAIRRQTGVFEKIAWFIVLCWALLSHDSCILLCFLLLATAAAINLLRHNWHNAPGMAMVFVALIVSVTLQGILTWGIHHVTGQEPLRFPLIEARLIEDGTGTRYLQTHCPQSGFVLCDYVQKFPEGSQEFLFCTQPRCAVYETADYERRRALSAEQFRFLVAVVKYDPLGVLQNGLRNTVRQLFDFSLGNFLYSSHERHMIDDTFPYRVSDRIHASTAYRGTWPERLVSLFYTIFFVGALAYVFWGIIGFLPGLKMSASIRRMALWTVLGILLNAAICGAISDPQPRYQARVLWTLPLVVLLAEVNKRNEHRPSLELAA